MGFKCWVASAALKCWGRAIHTLVAAGENDIHFSISQNSVTMTSIDSSLTVVCQCKFDRTFFCRYEFQGDSDFTCRLPSKCLLKPFKSLRFFTRCSDACEMEFDSERNSMAIIIPCKGGVKVRHRLQFSVELEPLDLDFDSGTLGSCIAADPKLMLQSLSNFTLGKGVSDLTLKVGANKLLMKNCVNDMLKKEGKVYTELTLNAVDFRMYAIDEESELTFPMREFKSIIGFAEHMRASLTMNFKGPRDPFQIKVQNEDGLYLATLVLATSAPLQTDRANSRSQQSTTRSNTQISLPSTTSTPMRTPAKKRAKPGDDTAINQDPSDVMLALDEDVIAIDDPVIVPGIPNPLPSSSVNFEISAVASNQVGLNSYRVVSFPRSSQQQSSKPAAEVVDLEDELPGDDFVAQLSQSLLDAENDHLLAGNDGVVDQNAPLSPELRTINRDMVRRKRMKMLFPDVAKVFVPERDIPGYTEIYCEATDEEDN